jgi:hypothetical protein
VPDEPSDKCAGLKFEVEEAGRVAAGLNLFGRFPGYLSMRIFVLSAKSSGLRELTLMA